MWPDPFAAPRYADRRPRAASPTEQATDYIRRLEAEVRALRTQVGELETRQRPSPRVDPREQALSERAHELEAAQRSLAVRDRELQARRRELQERERELAERLQEATTHEHQLSARARQLDDRARELAELARPRPESAGESAQSLASGGRQRIAEAEPSPLVALEDQTDLDSLDLQARRIRQLELAVVGAENELEAAKDRIRREAARDLEQKKRELLSPFLAVLDDLDRALAAGRSHEGEGSLVEGVELVRKNFLAALEEHAIHPDPAVGKRFDPSRHQAISTIESDQDDEGMISVVVREGYRIGDETLRPAMVVVKTRRRGS